MAKATTEEQLEELRKYYDLELVKEEDKQGGKDE